MVKPWAEAGYECYCFDLQNKNTCEGNVFYVRADLSTNSKIIQKVGGREVVFVSAFPPCTHLAVSGARWFKGKGLRALQESIGFFATAAEFCEASRAPYLIENPMSTISTYWREPDCKFHPAQYQGYTSEFADYTKETWLWTGGGFVMPSMSMEPDLFHEPDKTYIHHQPPGEDRANIRSKTPPGFPQAVYEYNAPDSAFNVLAEMQAGAK
jgi:hypothetical protein